MPNLRKIYFILKKNIMLLDVFIHRIVRLFGEEYFFSYSARLPAKQVSEPARLRVSEPATPCPVGKRRL